MRFKFVCVYVNPSVRPWRGRTRGWDTTQRTRAVLQPKKKMISPPQFICEEGFPIHCSGHQMVLQRHAWSTLCRFRNEDEGMRRAERHSHRGHHNSTAKWLMVTINVAPEERGYLKCCGGGRVMFFTLQIGGPEEQTSLCSLVGEMYPHFRRLRSHWSVQVPNKWNPHALYGQVNK